MARHCASQTGIQFPRVHRGELRGSKSHEGQGPCGLKKYLYRHIKRNQAKLEWNANIT